MEKLTDGFAENGKFFRASAAGGVFRIKMEDSGLETVPRGPRAPARGPVPLSGIDYAEITGKSQDRKW